MVPIQNRDPSRGRTVTVLGGGTIPSGQNLKSGPVAGQSTWLVDAHFDDETPVTLNIQQTGGNLSATITIVYWIGGAMFTLPSFGASQSVPDTIRLACRAVRVTAQCSGAGSATVSGGVVVGDVDPLAEGIPPTWQMRGTVGASDTPVSGAPGKLLSVSGSCNNMGGQTALWLFLCDAASLFVGSVGVNSKGSGYTSPPAVGFSGGGGAEPAIATAVMGVEQGNETITSKGGGYTSVPTVTFSAAPLGGVTASAVAVMGVESSDIHVSSGGAGYTTAPAVTFSAPGSGTTATGTATIAGGQVTGITITNPGSGYTSPPTISFSGGGGSGAAATCTMSVEDITVQTSGSGYTSPPTISFSGGGGAGAAATCTMSVEQITLVDAGAGYVSAPTVTLSGGGGSGATATTTFSFGQYQGLVPPIMITQVGQFGFSDELRVKGLFIRGVTWILSTTQNVITLATGSESARVDLGVG